MALTLAQRNRLIRKEALKEQLSAQCHYQHFLDAIGKMTELAERPIDQEARDRFAMYNAIADRHWKVVLRYLPPPDTQQGEIGVRTINIQPVMTHE